MPQTASNNALMGTTIGFAPIILSGKLYRLIYQDLHGMTSGAGQPVHLLIR